MKLNILSNPQSGPQVDKGTMSRKKEGPLWVWPPALGRPQPRDYKHKGHSLCLLHQLPGTGWEVAWGLRNPRLDLLKLLHPRPVLIILLSF